MSRPSEVGREAATYVYGVTRRLSSDDLPTRDAVEENGAPVRAVPHGELCAVVRDHEGGEVVGRRAELMDHTTVVEGLARDRAVLPLQFGVVFPGDEAVRTEMLAPHHDALSDQLTELDGLVEVGLKGFYDQETVLREIVASRSDIASLREQTAAGAGYQAQVRLGELVAGAFSEVRDRDAAAIDARLRPLAAEVRRRQPPAERGCFDASFLVAAEELSAFDEEVAAVDRDAGDRVTFSYVGPLPPYHFVDLRLSTPAADAG